MAATDKEKIGSSLHKLEAALKFYDQGPDPDGVKFLAVAKAFEVGVEYAWKELKRRVEAEGLDAITPKDAVRQAAKMGLIKSAESWIGYINARNSGVHDYWGLSEKEYLAAAREFLKEGRKIF